MKNVFDSIYPYLKLRITQSLYVTHDRDWFENKTKAEYTIWNIAKGNLFVRANEKLYRVSGGDIVLFSPGTKYIASTDENGCEFLYQRFSADMGNDISILNDINFSGIIPKKYMGKDCLEYCSAIHPKHTGLSRLSLESYSLFLAYFTKIINAAQNAQLTPFSDMPSMQAKSHMWRIMSYMGEHFTEKLSVSELAKMARLSEKHFTAQFHKTIGVSPKQYIIGCRMQLAAELLTTSDVKIQEIAERTGYPNAYSFSKAFKGYYDESPTEYRKRFIR